jgi:hypothetical protein
MSSKNGKMGIFPSISLSAIRRKIVDQAGCFENTRDFPSEEIPLGYRLRSPLLSSRNHSRSALLTVFSITHPDLFYNADLEMLTAFMLMLTDLGDINIIGQSLEKTKFTKRSNDEKPHS